MVPSACASLTALVRRRANPLDYRVSGPVAADSPPGPVDVIVPVYGAADDLRRCLASLRRHTASRASPAPGDRRAAARRGRGGSPRNAGRCRGLAVRGAQPRATRLRRERQSRHGGLHAGRGAPQQRHRSDRRLARQASGRRVFVSGGGHGHALLEQRDPRLLAAVVRGQRDPDGPRRRFLRRPRRAGVAPRVSPDPHRRGLVPLHQAEGPRRLGSLRRGPLWPGLRRRERLLPACPRRRLCPRPRRRNLHLPRGPAELWRVAPEAGTRSRAPSFQDPPRLPSDDRPIHEGRPAPAGPRARDRGSRSASPAPRRLGPCARRPRGPGLAALQPRRHRNLRPRPRGSAGSLDAR